MKYAGLYHLNAYTYGDPTWFPDMDPELRAMFQKVTIGSLSRRGRGKDGEDFAINDPVGTWTAGENVTLHGVNYPKGVVPEFPRTTATWRRPRSSSWIRRPRTRASPSSSTSTS